MWLACLLRHALVLSASDNFELERLSDTLRSQRRQLTELEEQRAAQADVAASIMAGVTAQIQAIALFDMGLG